MLEDYPHYDEVFPTQVGVIPMRRSGTKLRPRIPHASGGDPPAARGYGIITEYSPRKWG